MLCLKAQCMFGKDERRAPGLATSTLFSYSRTQQQC